MSQLEQSEVKEIFHRVKNNLQVISSLVELQLMESTNPEVQAALREAISRMQVFVIIYQQLIPEKKFAAVDFTKVISEILRTRGEEPGMPGISAAEIEAMDFILETETAIPLALVINELITLSSVSGVNAGVVRQMSVRCYEKGDGMYELAVQDKAFAGFEHHGAELGDESFGMRLINGLSRQIGGGVKLPVAGSEPVVISFKRKKKVV